MILKKKKISIFLLILIILFLGIWNIIDGNYDKQNKVILFLKEFIPTKISRKIRDTIFIIPDLKTVNKDLNLQLTKYEQGLDGQLFSENEFNLETKKVSYKNS